MHPVVGLNCTQPAAPTAKLPVKTFKRMNMKNDSFFLIAFAFLFLTLLTACENGATEQATAIPGDTVKTTTATLVTNPNFIIAPETYAVLNEQALQHFARLDYDAWGNTLADDIAYAFPDGDTDTRTKLEGKAAVLNWWKNWKEKSGIQSMTLTAFNHFPLQATQPLKAGATMGMYDVCYFSNKMVFNGKPVSLRMNFVAHFNGDKKIDRIAAYYDRSVIIKATGKNMLDELKAK
jgi:ketosteroid isomerase-like protein